LERGDFLLAHFLESRRLLDFLDEFQATDAFTDRRQIGQRSRQATLVDKKLTAGQGRFFHCLLRLFLAPDKQNLPAAPRYFLQKLSGALQLPYRLIQVDDVDLVFLLENVGPHFRVPALGLVPKCTPASSNSGTSSVVSAIGKIQRARRLASER
jgi:hypothetical protein